MVIKLERIITGYKWGLGLIDSEISYWHQAHASSYLSSDPLNNNFIILIWCPSGCPMKVWLLTRSQGITDTPLLHCSRNKIVQTFSMCIFGCFSFVACMGC